MHAWFLWKTRQEASGEILRVMNEGPLPPSTQMLTRGDGNLNSLKCREE